MKILLVGEYSRLHNSLKEGLLKLGHEVIILGTGDGFKDYPVDIRIHKKYVRGLAKKWRVLLYSLFGLDAEAQNIKKQFFRHAEQLQGFDVVQLINESPLGATPKVEREIISYLAEHNHHLFLLCCGTDYLSVQHIYQKKQRYSILSSYFAGTSTAMENDGALKYLRPDYKELHEYVYSKIEGVIASSLDYDMPMKGHPLYLGMIPNPVNTEKIETAFPKSLHPLVIFHGINRSSYYKKGSDLFEKALNIIAKKYPDKVEILLVEDLPYTEYMQAYERAHIVLDQVYAYDQGYNALEAMARGKLVLTGAEKEFMEHYQLQEPVAINVLPEVEQIVDELEKLIQNPTSLKAIGERARAFIEREHHYKKIAEKYLETWKRA